MSFNSNKYSKSHDLWISGNNVIPNGVQTLSKSPLYITFGAVLFMLRGPREHTFGILMVTGIDYPLAMGPVVLGYAYDEVDSAVREQISRGILYSLSNRKEIFVLS